MSRPHVATPLAAVLGSLMLAVGGCSGGWEVSRMPNPSASSIITSSDSPTEPVYEFVYHSPGESLTLLKRVERLMVRARKLKGKANEAAQNDACALLGKAIEGASGSVWPGTPILEALEAGHNCWSDPPMSLKHLRVVIDALESAGVTPEPAPELTP